MIETPPNPEKMNAHASKTDGSKETLWMKTVETCGFCGALRSGDKGAA